MKDRDTRILEQEGRVPPQAVEVEENVLGAMMIEEEAKVLALDRLKAADFYKPAHKHIFNAIKRLHEKDQQADLLSVEQQLRRKELLAVCGGSGYLSELTRSVSSAANIDYHAQIIVEKATKRNIILGCTDVIKSAYSSDSDPFNVLDKMQDVRKKIEEQSFLEIPKSSSEAAADTLKTTVEELNVKNGLVGLPTFLPIDTLTAGFPPKEVIFIAARPSMGKTAYMLTIIKNLIEHDWPEPLLIFSYEMSKEILILRLLCMMAKVNMHHARRGKLKDPEKVALVQAAEKMGIKARWNTSKQKLEIESIEDSILFIVDDNKTDPGKIEATARRIKQEHGLGGIFVDYLQLVPVYNTRQKNLNTREQEVAHISGSMKDMAKALNVPVIPLSQLSRKVENRPGDNRPELSDMRYSGSIEQDATMVMFLYRPMYYDIKRTEEGVSTKGLTEVLLKKNRNGPTGMEKHYFIKQFATFKEWDEEAAAMREGSGPPQGQPDWMLGKDDPQDRGMPDDVDDELPF